MNFAKLKEEFNGRFFGFLVNTIAATEVFFISSDNLSLVVRGISFSATAFLAVMFGVSLFKDIKALINEHQEAKDIITFLTCGKEIENADS